MSGGAAAIEGRASEARSILVFVLGGRLCALPSSAVAEIVFLPALARPPGAPSFVEGFMNLDGRAVPVIRLERLFDLPPSEFNLYAPVIVMKGAGPMAVLVDQVRDVRRAPQAEILEVNADSVFGGCLDAEIGTDDGIVHLLSPSRLLLTQEARRLDEFKKREQERLASLEEVEA